MMMMNVKNDYCMLLLDLILIRAKENTDMYYYKMYEAITVSYKAALIKEKPIEIISEINELVQYYENKEEYEKCIVLHQLGFEIYNTIN
jgi:hypothetical protein